MNLLSALRAASLVTTLAVALLHPRIASAEFGPLPTLDGQKSPLQLQVVNYTGGTNGEMIVEVKNPTRSSQTFQASGLFFVPGGDPEKAPQRLGAAGPFQAQSDKDHNTFVAAEKLELAPGAVKRLKLQVYCIDSHRASPTAQHAFSLGKQRLPKMLRAEIEGKTRVNLARHRPARGAADFAAPAPAAKAAIQSDVWAARNKKWIPLEGERAAEQAAPSGPQEQRRQAPRRPRPIELQEQQAR